MMKERNLWGSGWKNQAWRGLLQGQKRNQSPRTVLALLWWALAGAGSHGPAHRPPSSHPSKSACHQHIVGVEGLHQLSSCWDTAMDHPSRTTPASAPRLGIVPSWLAHGDNSLSGTLLSPKMKGGIPDIQKTAGDVNLSSSPYLYFRGITWKQPRFLSCRTELCNFSIA